MEILKKYFALLTGIIVFIIYLFTLAPSVIQIDAGELAAVQVLPGIAHPTGYPLFTIIGYIYSIIPLPFEMIYRLNLLAAIYCASGTGIFVYTSKLILDNLNKFSSSNSSKQSKKKQNKQSGKVQKTGTEFSQIIIYISSITGGLILAFSQTFWFQSTSVEVYSLHILLINLIILFLIKAYLSEDETGEVKVKSLWILFAVFLALGFTNHMTTLLILPGVAYLYFIKYKFFKSSIQRIGLMLLFFIPVLFIVYAYLPIRASMDPIINWGNPDNFERLMRHISGKQYQVWLFESTEAAKENLTYFINNLTSEFRISLVFSVIGLFTSVKLVSRFSIFIIITFLSTVFYSINYDIVDLDSYFLLAFISLAFLSVFGIYQVIDLFIKNKINIYISSAVILIVIGIQTFVNFNDVDQSDNYIFEDYTKALLKSTDENSIILSYQWDYFISPSYYFQNVKDFRKDIRIVDKELLRRSWYYKQLETNYPELLNGMKNDVNSFLNALKPFERSENYNAKLLESLYRKIMQDLIITNDEISFYLGPEMIEQEMQKGEFTLPEDYYLVPDLFLFKVVNRNEYIPADDPDFNIRIPENQNRYTDFIERNVASMLARRAMYELQFNKIDRAKIYVKKIRTDFPRFRIPPQLVEIN